MRRLIGWCAAWMMVSASAGQAQQPVTIPKPATTVRMPPGPYATWSTEQAQAVERAMEKACFDAAPQLINQYRVPEEMVVAEAGAVTLGCMIENMPSDWPGQAEARSRAQQFAEGARHSDPGFRLPTLEAGK